MDPNPWDQLPDEKNDSYVHFLIFRNLGPARTVDLAYSTYLAQIPDDPTPAARKRGGKKQPGPKAAKRASSTWWQESRNYEWTTRATAWDIYHFTNVVPDGAIAIMHVVAETAKATLRALQAGTIKPNSWAELLNGVELLTSFVSADTVSHLLAGRPRAELAAGGGDESQGAVDASTGATNTGA